MAENINGTNPLSSGGHVWQWQDRHRTRKTLSTVGVAGQATILTGLAGRQVTIGGREGSPGVLKVTGANKAACDAALTALEATIDALCDAGLSVAWEDDQAHSGTALVLERFDRQGHRVYGPGGTSAWQFYYLYATDQVG